MADVLTEDNLRQHYAAGEQQDQSDPSDDSPVRPLARKQHAPSLQDLRLNLLPAQPPSANERIEEHSAGDVASSQASQTPSLTRGMNKDDMRAQLRALRLQGGRRAVPTYEPIKQNPRPREPPAKEAYVPFAVAAKAAKDAIDGHLTSIPNSIEPNTQTRVRRLSLTRRNAPLETPPSSNGPNTPRIETSGASPIRTFGAKSTSNGNLPATSWKPRSNSQGSTSTGTTTPRVPLKSPMKDANLALPASVVEGLSRAKQELDTRRVRAANAAAIAMLQVAIENTTREVHAMEYIQGQRTNNPRSRMFDTSGNPVDSSPPPSDREQLINLLIEKKADRVMGRHRYSQIITIPSSSPKTHKSTKSHSPMRPLPQQTNPPALTLTPSQQDDVLAMYDQLHRASDLLRIAGGLLQMHCLKNLQGLTPVEIAEMGVQFPSPNESKKTAGSDGIASVTAFLERESLTNAEVAESLAELNSKFRSRLQQLHTERSQSLTPTPIRKYLGSSSDLVFASSQLPPSSCTSAVSGTHKESDLGEGEIVVPSPFSADVAREMIISRCGLDVPNSFYSYPLGTKDAYHQQVQNYLGALAFVADVHRGRLRIEKSATVEKEKKEEMDKRALQRHNQELPELWPEVESVGDSDSELMFNDVGSVFSAEHNVGETKSAYYSKLAREIEEQHPLNRHAKAELRRAREAAEATRANAEAFQQSTPGEGMLKELSPRFRTPNRTRSPYRYRRKAA